MDCETWQKKIDAYLDAELPADESVDLERHLKNCEGCSAGALATGRMRRMTRVAGKRFAPSYDLRERIQKQVAPPKRVGLRAWLPRLALATAVVAVLGAILWLRPGSEGSNERLTAELLDQHITTLASANPVDVFSTDRHTVKPWFEGRIPFTFNLPELAGTPFTLLGGRVMYLAQAPVAHLLFGFQKHRISVFIFREEGSKYRGEQVRTASAYYVNAWSAQGLCYVIISDVSGEENRKFSDLLKNASSSAVNTR